MFLAVFSTRLQASLIPLSEPQRLEPRGAPWKSNNVGWVSSQGKMKAAWVWIHLFLLFFSMHCFGPGSKGTPKGSCHFGSRAGTDDWPGVDGPQRDRKITGEGEGGGWLAEKRAFDWIGGKQPGTGSPVSSQRRVFLG